MSHQQEAASLANALQAHLERDQRRGRRRVPVPVLEAQRPLVAAPTSTAPLISPTAKPPATPSAAPNSPAALAASARTLEELRTAVSTCQACSLCETRKQTVFADGDGSARVLFIGEAPGAEEDARGIPFVGRAGALLSDIITKGMQMRREDVYIANVLKCRPPENRDPSQQEKALCTAWLDRQIELVNPAVIITLGKHASQHVLGCEDSMGSMRGKIHERGGRPIVPTYHPAFLLRSPNMKKDCWQDIQRALERLAESA
jgi:uracil-DNA glycosylase family 4